MKVRWLFGVPLLLLVPARFSPAFAEQIRVGDLEQRVLSLHGKPSREISTGSGSILFYGPLLVSIEAGAVRFVSLSSTGNPQCGRVSSEAHPVRPSARVRVVQRPRVPVDEATEKVERKLVERMRRMLVMEIYRAMVGEMASVALSPVAGWRSLDGGSLPAARNGLPRSCEQVSLVSVKDCQSFRVGRCGEDSEIGDQFVTVGETLGGAWSGGM